MSNIPAHGGQLISRMLDQAKCEYWLKRVHFLPSCTLTPFQYSDLICIATGVYSPLTGFLRERDYNSVLNDMRLSNGLIWTLPITLSITEEVKKQLLNNDHIILRDPHEQVVAVMEIHDIYTVLNEKEAIAIYKTTDKKHPGVQKLRGESSIYIGGDIHMIAPPDYGNYASYAYTPEQLRTEFNKRNWRKIVAFQTRNPVHRAHEYLQKTALEMVDALFLHPIVGETKKDDVPADIRMKSYEVLLQQFFPADRAMLGILPAGMRYAGPREAVFHALVRKNYGCTHFIVGRDHAGVGDYYGTYESQQIFANFSTAELGIQLFFFENSFYCSKCNGMATIKTCPHSEEHHLQLSGTKVREMLKVGTYPPVEFMRQEIAKVLMAKY